MNYLFYRDHSFFSWEVRLLLAIVGDVKLGKLDCNVNDIILKASDVHQKKV